MPGDHAGGIRPGANLKTGRRPANTLTGAQPVAGETPAVPPPLPRPERMSLPRPEVADEKEPGRRRMPLGYIRAGIWAACAGWAGVVSMWYLSVTMKQITAVQQSASASDATFWIAAGSAACYAADKIVACLQQASSERAGNVP